MKTKILIFGSLAFLGLATSVRAIPISGQINFGGSAALTPADVGSAISISFSGYSITSGTGAYFGAAGTTVDQFNGFTFGPFFTSPNPNLWNFHIGSAVYSMTGATLTSIIRNTGSGILTLQGTGVANISGYDATPGTWVITATATQTGFNFSSTTTAVSDGGTTLMLLGGALSGLALCRKKLSI